jgi:hypothetical protein
VEKRGCDPISWSATTEAAWLTSQRIGDQLEVTVNPQSLSVGQYTGEVTVDASDDIQGSAVQVPVTLDVVEQRQHTHLPLVQRDR